MWKAVSIVGWLLALLMTILWWRETGEQRQLEALSQEQAVGRPATEQPVNQQAAAEQPVNRQASAEQAANQRPVEDAFTEQQVRTLTTRLDDAEAQVLELRAEERRLVKRAEDAEELTEVEREWRESISGLETIDRMVEIGTSQLVESQYEDFLLQLSLDDETMLHVNDIIGLAYTDLSMQGLEWLVGGQPEMLSEADYGRWMSEELSYFLSSEDLAVFDQYQASLPGGMIGQQLEMQLANFSSELTEESRATIRDIVVEEMLSGSWLASYDGEATPGAVMDSLYRQAARERLVDYLDNEQLAIYDSFAEQQILGIRVALGLMD
jgi:hypothetical protein